MICCVAVDVFKTCSVSLPPEDTSPSRDGGKCIAMQTHPWSCWSLRPRASPPSHIRCTRHSGLVESQTGLIAINWSDGVGSPTFLSPAPVHLCLLFLTSLPPSLPHLSTLCLLGLSTSLAFADADLP